AQAENGEDIRCIDYEGIQRDGEHRRNGIYRKKNVGGFDDQEHDQQRSRVKPVTARKELPADILFCYRKNAAEQAKNGILLGMDFRLALAQQLDSRIDEQSAECVGDPTEARD